MRRWPVLSVALLAVFLGALAGCRSHAPDKDLAALETVTILASGQGAPAPVSFKVELARTADELHQGLRYRDHMDPDKGMLFDLGRTRVTYFTMSDTIIPLDMIFISRDGKIVEIIENTTPFDHGPFGPDVPVRGVLEINGGLSAQHGIKPGDVVAHPLFGTGAGTP